MKDILTAPFVREMCETTANMYRLGWDERNGGNISYLLDEKEVAQYLDLTKVVRTIPFMGVNEEDFDASPLEGKIFIVTGTGKYFKNVEKDPANNLGIVRIGRGGKNIELLWGYEDGRGEPIQMTIVQFLEEFIFSVDYTQATAVGVDQVVMSGNSLENVQDAYPDCRFVDLCYPSLDPAYEGLDWCSLKMVFAPTQSGWYLVGLIHSQWTI